MLVDNNDINKFGRDFKRVLSDFDEPLRLEPTIDLDNRNLVLWNKGCPFAEDNLIYSYSKKSYVSESSGRALCEILKERPHLQVLDQLCFMRWHELNAKKYDTNELTEESKQEMNKEIIEMCQLSDDEKTKNAANNNITKKMK